MKIIVSDKTRKAINNEYARFMEDPMNLARLKMKLTFNQRIFIETFQEAYNNKTDSINNEDKLLLMQEAILSFNANPELVPNAPIELLKRSVTFNGTPDDFEQLLVLIKVWRNSVNRSKRPINRLAMFFAKWYKMVLYPFFVVSLSGMFTSILSIGTTYFIYRQIDTMYLSIAIVLAFVSVAAGKGIYYRILAENTLKE